MYGEKIDQQLQEHQYQGDRDKIIKPSRHFTTQPETTQDTINPAHRADGTPGTAKNHGNHNHPHHPENPQVEGREIGVHQGVANLNTGNGMLVPTKSNHHQQ